METMATILYGLTLVTEKNTMKKRNLYMLPIEWFGMVCSFLYSLILLT